MLSEIRGRTPVIVMSFLLLLTLFAAIDLPERTGGSNGSFCGGSGTAGDPYLIEDVEDLQAMKDGPTYHYALANDIDAYETKDWNGGSGFVPLGVTPNLFKGSLDGRGHTISGLTIKGSSMVGLFCDTQTGSKISNLTLEEMTVSGTQYVGGLIGSNSGIVSRCKVEGSIIGSGSYVGGLAGWNIGFISNSSFSGNVSGRSYTGGLVGYSFRSIEFCNSTGFVNGTERTGGLAGVAYGVFRSFASSTVSGTSAGGLVGEGREIRDCYSLSNVTGYWAGGLCGSDDGSVYNSFYDIEKVLINGSHRLTFWGLYDDQYIDWFDSDLSLNISDYNSTIVKYGDHFNISTIQGFKDMLGFIREPIEVRLGSDIDFSMESEFYFPFLAINKLDGQGFSIQNFHGTNGFIF